MEAITEYIPRRTYIEGTFKGQFTGKLDFSSSNLAHDLYYDIEIDHGIIDADRSSLRTWDAGCHDDFEEKEDALVKFPEVVRCRLREADGQIRGFHLSLQEPKLHDIRLQGRIQEGNRVYGDIEARINCCIIHHEESVRYVTTAEPEDFWIKTSRTKTRTGNSEHNGSYIRYEYYNSDGSTYWGKWQHVRQPGAFNLWSTLGSLLQALLFLPLLAVLFMAGWQALFILLVFGLISLLGPVLSFIIDRAGRPLLGLMGFLLVGFMISGLISSSSRPSLSQVEYVPPVQPPITEQENILPDPVNPLDSIITHRRVWHDYQDNLYAGDLSVRLGDVARSRAYRQRLDVSNNPSPYDAMLARLYDRDRDDMDLLTAMFDSIRYVHNLDEVQFAEVITACIQHIPYTLILSDACDVNRYTDPFIQNYLASGEPCEGDVKYGVHTPLEFTASLKGDCDTRTLMLFTLLDHFEYDVAIFSSDLYSHSLLGINLPYEGTYKSVHGKRYVLWETTFYDLPPGLIDNEMSDTRYWYVSLLNRTPTT